MYSQLSSLFSKLEFYGRDLYLEGCHRTACVMMCAAASLNALGTLVCHCCLPFLPPRIAGAWNWMMFKVSQPKPVSDSSKTQAGGDAPAARGGRSRKHTWEACGFPHCAGWSLACECVCKLPIEWAKYVIIQNS